MKIILLIDENFVGDYGVLIKILSRTQERLESFTELSTMQYSKKMIRSQRRAGLIIVGYNERKNLALQLIQKVNE